MGFNAIYAFTLTIFLVFMKYGIHIYAKHLYIKSIAPSKGTQKRSKNNLKETEKLQELRKKKKNMQKKRVKREETWVLGSDTLIVRYPEEDEDGRFENESIKRRENNKKRSVLCFAFFLVRYCVQ